MKSRSFFFVCFVFFTPPCSTLSTFFFLGRVTVIDPWKSICIFPRDVMHHSMLAVLLTNMKTKIASAAASKNSSPTMIRSSFCNWRPLYAVVAHNAHSNMSSYIQSSELRGAWSASLWSTINHRKPGSCLKTPVKYRVTFNVFLSCSRNAAFKIIIEQCYVIKLSLNFTWWRMPGHSLPWQTI